MYAVEDDPYCYPGTDVLRNKFDIMDAATLEQLELELTTARADEPLPGGRLDEIHFRAIHRHLFQDLYDWAGEPRTVRLVKEQSPFCYPEHIESQLTSLFAQLQADTYLSDLDTNTFAQRCAAFLATLNVIHTFREGNGRTQLAFVAVLAEQAGHPLNFDRLRPEEMLSAMIASFFGDETLFAGVLVGLCS